ncbi:MAG: hypothetical protein ACJ72O_11620 [Marmoricola sp.]
MELKPLVIARFGHALGAVAFAAGASNLWGRGSSLGSIAAVVVISTCCVALVRAMLMKVVLNDDRIIIRGLLWSRHIPRAEVTSVSDFPAVRWTDQYGKSHWSPVLWMMTGSRTLGFINNYNRAELKKLRKWVKPKRR